MASIGISAEKFKQEIPITVKNKHILVKVNIQNADYTFVVGTGVNYCLIDSTLAQKLNLPNLATFPTENDNGNLGKIKVVTSPKIMIGNIAFSEVPFYVVSMKSYDDCDCSDTPKGIDGLIGLNLLEKMVWQFDYKNQKAVICNHQDSLRFAADKKILPMNRHYYDGIPSISLRINQNYIAELIVASENCTDIYLSDRLAEQNKTLGSKHLTSYMIDIYSRNRIDSFKIRYIENLNIGNAFYLKNAIISTDSSKSNSIGGEFLSQFVCTFDFGKAEMILSDYQPKEKMASFGYYLMPLDHKIIVQSLIKNTAPYLAGLKIRDHVVSINNTDVSNLSAEDFYKLNDVYKNEEVKIRVKREDKIIDFTFPKFYFIDKMK